MIYTHGNCASRYQPAPKSDDKMTILTLSGQWRDHEIILQVPAWTVPLRHIRLTIDGAERAAWRGYWKKGHLEVLPDGSKLTVELYSYGLAQRASLKVDGQEIAAGSAPRPPAAAYWKYGITSGLLFGALYGAGQYVCSDTTFRSAGIQALAAGPAFGGLMTFINWFEERRGIKA